MAKLYWATEPDAEKWRPCEDREGAIEQARAWSMREAAGVQTIWVAPADPAFDDDDQFWAAVAQTLLWDLECLEERLVEEGWADPEEAWLPLHAEDVDSALANALRKVLPPRPEFRTVVIGQAERVDL